MKSKEFIFYKFDTKLFKSKFIVAILKYRSRSGLAHQILVGFFFKEPQIKKQKLLEVTT
jgi:hypothetical protein